jgi:hypothetical protein
MDVDIHNFQSIEHVSVRIDGFTSLIGRSNLGKSAIVRAIKSALTGAPEDDDIRHVPTCEREVKGSKSCKCYCSVHLKADDFDLLWEKGGGKNEYLFNGQKYTAVGKGTPDFLESAFGVVKIGERKVLLQVADQFRHEGGGPIFLLDEPGSVIADVLSDVAQLDRINLASRMAEKDRRDSIAQRKVREKDVIDLKLKSVSFDGLDEVLGRIQRIEVEDLPVVAKKRQKRDQLAAFKDSVILVGRQVKALMGVSNVLVPQFLPIQGGHSKVKILRSFLHESALREQVIDKLAGVEDVQPPAIENVRTLCVKFDKLVGWVTRLRTFKDFFSRGKDIETALIPEIDGLWSLTERGIELARFHSRATALESAVSRLEQAVEIAEKEFSAVEAEKTELGVCPTCAQPVTFDHDHAAE